MKTNAIYIIWRGQKTGPFTAKQVENKIVQREVSALHQLEIDGACMSVKDYLASLQPPAAAARPKLKASMPPPLPEAEAAVRGRAAEYNLSAAEDSSEGGFFSGISDQVSSMSGLDRLQGFSFSRLFSEVFSKHTTEEVEERFVVGTRHTTPAIAEVDTRWPTPWVFVRLLLVALITTAIFYFALGRFGNTKLIPGLIFAGCFAIPFAVLVFFFEVNVLRNVSIYRVLLGLLFGGVLSLFASLFLFERLDFLTSWLGASSAGPIEESGKLLAALFIARVWKDKTWTLSGLLIGASVGTGFAIFESAGYVFEALVGITDHDFYLTMVLRAVLSPFTHTIWTAAAVGALWRVRRMHGASWSNLLHWGFLRVFFIVVVLHMAWNSSVLANLADSLLGPLGSLVASCFIGLVGWALVFQLIQAGLTEVREAKARQSSLGFSE